jgi:hypothetical protein
MFAFLNDKKITFREVKKWKTVNLSNCGTHFCSSSGRLWAPCRAHKLSTSQKQQQRYKLVLLKSSYFKSLFINFIIHRWACEPITLLESLFIELTAKRFDFQRRWKVWTVNALILLFRNALSVKNCRLFFNHNFLLDVRFSIISHVFLYIKINIFTDTLGEIFWVIALNLKILRSR